MFGNTVKIRKCVDKYGQHIILGDRKVKLEAVLILYYLMPITTRTLAKGVPPRLHEPKPKGKPRTQNTTASKANAKEPGSRKRSTRDDDSDNEDDDVSASDDSASRAKKKKNGKRRRTEPEVESEVEIVDEDVEPPEKDVEDVEGVEHGVGGQEPPNEQDVSTSHISWTLGTHHTLG